MTMKPFDPIVVAEQRNRISAHRDVLAKADAAATALLWFDEYALGNPEAVSLSAGVSAYATPNADFAAAYVKRAAKPFASLILDAAIEAARADLAAAISRAEAPPIAGGGE